MYSWMCSSGQPSWASWRCRSNWGADTNVTRDRVRVTVPSHHSHQNLGGVQRDVRWPWNHRRVQPRQPQRSRQQSLGGVQRLVERAWTHWELQPRQRQCCHPLRGAAALTSSKHCCGSITAAALASWDGAVSAEATAGTADTVMAGCEGRPGHSLKRGPFWWQS